jgi:serine/threonine-protein kinase
MEDAEAVLRPGYRLDRYELLCPVASGGMAAVWLARLRGKRGFEKLFAIKTIKGELNDARFQEMFLDEARIASGIEHPNVAHIIDLGEQDEILYLVMEWVDGESIAKLHKLTQKKNKLIPLGVILRSMADACAGLHAAHELKDAEGNNLGVVHRDVSPHNILMATNGAVKVIDFGVAKAKNRRAGETGEGIVKGKIRFMAPEQVLSKGVDRRADVWAIGVCLHELVLGQLPFDNDSDVEVVRRLMSDEPPPPIPSSVPAPVRELLAHSLVRNPNERFDTCNAMKKVLENAIVKLGLDGGTEDVAEWLRENFGELASKRKEIMTKAVSQADARAASRPQSLVDTEEVAFAPTVVSSREPKTRIDSGVTPLKRPPPVPLEERTSAKMLLEGRKGSRDDSKSATLAAALGDIEPAGVPKGRGGLVFFIVLLAAAAGAWFVWPGQAKIKQFIAREPPPVTVPANPPPPVLSETALPSASAPPVTSVIPSASASASTSIPSTGPRPTATATATATASATATTTATATATATITVTAPPPPPPPSATDDTPY